jgi:hypothetical protein
MTEMVTASALGRIGAGWRAPSRPHAKPY